MQLMTSDIERQLKSAALDQAANVTPIIVKYFTPRAGAAWFVTEGEQLEDGDWRLFGFADLGDPQCAELGYTLLSQIAELRGPGGLRVERDLHYGPHTLADVLREYGKL